MSESVNVCKRTSAQCVCVCEGVQEVNGFWPGGATLLDVCQSCSRSSK